MAGDVLAQYLQRIGQTHKPGISALNGDHEKTPVSGRQWFEQVRSVRSCHTKTAILIARDVTDFSTLYKQNTIVLCVSSPREFHLPFKAFTSPPPLLISNRNLYSATT